MLITMNSTRRGKILFLKSNITTAKYNLISYFTRMIVTKAWQYLPYFFWIHQWTLSGMVAKDSFESVFNKMLNPTMTGGGERGSKWTATEKMTKKEKIVHMKSTSRPTHCPPLITLVFIINTPVGEAYGRIFIYCLQTRKFSSKKL